VVQFGITAIDGNDIFLHDDEDAKMYFKCDVVEEIRRQNGEFLKESDFKHIHAGKNLLSAVRKSIAPIKRISPAITVQKTMYWLND